MKVHKPPKNPPKNLSHLIYNEVRQAIPRIKYNFRNSASGSVVKLSTMGNIHDEDEYKIADIHCEECSFGIIVKFIKLITPDLIKHKSGKYLNVWGMSWAGNVDCYSFEVNEEFINKWWYHRILALAPLKNASQLKSELMQGPPKL